MSEQQDVSVLDVVAIEEMALELISSEMTQVGEQIRQLQARLDSLGARQKEISAHKVELESSVSPGAPAHAAVLSDVEKLRQAIRIVAADAPALDHPDKAASPVISDSDATAELRALFGEAHLASPLVLQSALPPSTLLSADSDLLEAAPGFDEPEGVVEEPAAAIALVVDEQEFEVPPAFDDQAFDIQAFDVPAGFDSRDDTPPGFDEYPLAAAPGALVDGDDHIPAGFDDSFGDVLPVPANRKPSATSDEFNFGF